MRDGFQNFKTSKYKLHMFETASGLKFVMLTDLNVGSLREVLQAIYSTIYVEYAVKNPLQCNFITPVKPFPKKKGHAVSECSPIDSELFDSKLDEYVQSLPMFS